MVILSIILLMITIIILLIIKHKMIDLKSIFIIMNNIKYRFLLFLCGCIVFRFLLVLIVKYINPDYLPYLGLLGLIQAIGFIIIYLGNYRKTGPEVFGSKIWWNNLRPIHASLYILFSLLALKKNNYSWVPLLIDVIIGLISFLIYHYIYR